MGSNKKKKRKRGECIKERGNRGEIALSSMKYFELFTTLPHFVVLSPPQFTLFLSPLPLHLLLPHPLFTPLSLLMGCVPSSVVDEEARARASPFRHTHTHSLVYLTLTFPSQVMRRLRINSGETRLWRRTRSRCCYLAPASLARYPSRPSSSTSNLLTPEFLLP